jgi:hypothetical protein
MVRLGEVKRINVRTTLKNGTPYVSILAYQKAEQHGDLTELVEQAVSLAHKYLHGIYPPYETRNVETAEQASRAIRVARDGEYHGTIRFATREYEDLMDSSHLDFPVASSWLPRRYTGAMQAYFNFQRGFAAEATHLCEGYAQYLKENPLSQPRLPFSRPKKRY